MKPHRHAALLSALLTVAVTAADVPPVVAPAARAASLAAAQKLLTPRDPAPPAGFSDPFHSEAYASAAATSGPSGVAVGGNTPSPATGVAARPAGPRSNRDLLASIADALRPGGFIVMAGQPSLSFGQKRVKPGGTLTINFEGSDYTVEVVAIDRANFTLRFNNEEYTRPIKK